MLQTIREHTQGWIAGIIITIIILSFALWGIHSYFVGGANNTVVAEVNGVEITKQEFAVTYERLRRQAQNQYGSNNPITAKSESLLKDRALQLLVDIEVLKQASLKQGFRVFDNQIDNYLQSMPEFQVNGQFSLERFQEILSTTLLSTSEFLDLIKTSLLMDQPKLGIIFTSFALPDETKYTIALVNQERSLDYITIPWSYFLAQPITISPEKIQAYYQQHQNEFMTPEQVNLEYIALSLNDLAAKITPTDSMLKNFYNENINSYTQPMEWKLIGVLVPVAANTTREQITQAEQKADVLVEAMKTNQDVSKSSQGYANQLAGQNWMTLNQVPVELQKAVAELTKQGMVSAPIKTSKGLMVVKVVEIKEPKMQAYEAVKDKVSEAYIHQHAEEKFAELRDELADVTYEHPDSLQLAAKKLNLPILISELFTKEKAGNGIAQSKKVRDTAFSNDVLNLQNNSDVIQLNPETLIVLRVKSHITSSLLPLKSVSTQIEQKLKVAEAESRAAKFAEDVKTKLQSGVNPTQLAAAYKLQWVVTNNMGRYSTKVDSAILDLAFRLANPQTVKSKVVYGVTRLPNGYAIVALKSVKAGAITDQKQYTVFAEQVQNSEGLLEYELYKQSQTSQAKINLLPQS